jgi:hypothetical protein
MTRSLFNGLTPRRQRHTRSAARLCLDCLEDRTVPSTFTVLNTEDTGTGSLRWAILAANANPGDDLITFDTGGTGTINLDSALPSLSSNIDLQGPGQNLLTVEPNQGQSFPAFQVASGATVSLSGVAVRFANGGIVNNGTLTVSGCTIADNAAPSGGGIDNTGTLTLNNSTVTNNAATDKIYGYWDYYQGIYYSGGAVAYGGGIRNTGTLAVTACTVAGNSGTVGAGIANLGTMVLSDSTVSGNTANGYSYESPAGGNHLPWVNGDGGGIFNSGSLTVENSTVATNTILGGNGSGIDNTGTLALRHSTVASNLGNVALLGLGTRPATNAGVSVDGGQVWVYDTIIAQNTPTDTYGIYTSLGHNLIGVDARLGPLQDNGGPTQTMALLADSLALNAGDNAGAPAADQRGLPRVVGGVVDIGAFEYQGTTSPYQGYVLRLYQDVLGRAPGDALALWVNALDSGAQTPFQVAYQLWVSPEHVCLAVDHWYQAFLGRAESPQEQSLWANALLTGALSEGQVVQLFLTSPEYTALHPTSQDYVVGLYNDVLARRGNYSAAEVAQWQVALEQGALSRAQAAQLFLSSSEATDVAVQGLFQAFLRRQPGAVELGQWHQALANGWVDGPTTAASFLSCPEYLARA